MAKISKTESDKDKVSEAEILRHQAIHQYVLGEETKDFAEVVAKKGRIEIITLLAEQKGFTWVRLLLPEDNKQCESLELLVTPESSSTNLFDRSKLQGLLTETLGIPVTIESTDTVRENYKEIVKSRAVSLREISNAYNLYVEDPELNNDRVIPRHIGRITHSWSDSELKRRKNKEATGKSGIDTKVTGHSVF